jgi:chloramphenicol-sensitive protein RarD
VFFGTVFLGERLQKWQSIAIGFAIVGVLYLIWTTGALPWITVILALSFAGYGFIRKKYPLDGATSLTLETFLILPFAVGYLWYLHSQGQMSFLEVEWQYNIGLLFAGAMTTAPLLLYLSALPRISLSTMGILQYIVPTLQFAIAIYIFKEPFDAQRFIAFSFIWTGLIVYTSSEIGKQHKRRKQAKGNSSPQ